MAKIYLSVVIPSYNEVSNLKRGVLTQVIKYLNKQDYTWEVILSDDGSSDGTLDQLQMFAKNQPNVKVLANPHRGKGPTVQSGLLAAKGEWRLFTDFDQSTPLKEIEKLFEFSDRYPIIIGSREISGAIRDKEPLHRHVMGKGFNTLVQTLAVPGIFDTQCGFKLFSAKAAVEVFEKLIVYGGDQPRHDAFTGAFDVEALFLARKLGFAIKEVPIMWQHHHTDRVSPIKDSLRMLRDILRIRVAHLQGKYNSA